MDIEKEKSGMLNIFLRVLRGLIKRGRFLNELSMDDRRNTWQIEADPVIEFVNDYVVKDSKQSIDADELYQEYLDAGGKMILKPTFNRKIMTLTKCKRVWTRTGGKQSYNYEGVTLRKHLRERGQSTL